MRANIVLPFHDPEGRFLRQLSLISPDLKQHFDHAFLSISPPTAARQHRRLRELRADPFFVLNDNRLNTQVGDHYLAGYESAIRHSPPHQLLHLCDIDKVAYALQSEYKARFIDDIHVAVTDIPRLFQRSAAAWATYPAIYRELEQMAIRIGELLFARYFDFAWSYLVIEAQQLNSIMPRIRSRDFGLLPEIVLLLKDHIQTQDVDWLAWEDPFIFCRDAAELQAERDNDPIELQKRLLWNKAVLEQVLAAIQ